MERWTDKLAVQTMKDFEKLQAQLLTIIAERLEMISELSQEELETLATASATRQFINEDIRRISKALESHRRKYAPRISVVMREVEKNTIEYAEKYMNYRKIPISRLKNRAKTEELIKAIQKQTVDELLNISHTYCYLYEGKVDSIGKTYRKIANRAIIDASTAGTNLHENMMKTIRNLSKSGIKTLTWEHENGKVIVRNAAAHIRMNINEGVNRLNAELQEENGKVFGADAVEISLHALCAPDHLGIQGKQYSIDEFDRINAQLQRPIGTLNCRHYVSYIIKDVTPSAHTESEIRQAVQRSTQDVEYDGKKMTRYQASQKMRARERDIRALRSEAKAIKATGNSDEVLKINNEIKRKENEYKAFCSIVGLTPQYERTKYYI